MRLPLISAPDYDVAGRTVFVTGAARGIGAAIAIRLHGAGANVALVGLEPDLLDELAASLGDRAAAFEADVTDYEALQRAVRGTVERFGGVDVGIANAGISYIGRLATAPMQQVERALEVNLMGVWRTDRALIEQITARRGYLLNIASLAAASHTPLMGPYSASKAGVEALTNSLRAETLPTGARVGCAYFGFIDTDLVRTSFAHPSSQILTGTLPKFISSPAPLSDAIDAIERGIKRRSARMWAPRYVGPALLLRGVLQPLSELQMRFNKDLPRALELADPARGGVEDQHSELGVSGDASRSRSSSAAKAKLKQPARRS
jgi:NAD(P)-dependent dehydrogenase (short-subunit alcohol dehydrogenase family)